MASEAAVRALWGLVVSCALLACGGEPRFPLREPLWQDADHQPFSPAPQEYVSPFAWDGANQLVFRPVSRFFAVDPAGPAVNVNAYDEVPDSSWFENRIGRAPLTAAQLQSGPCGSQVLDVNMPAGSWIIDKGKPNGANPGFRVDVPGVGKFMLKADPAGEPARATGATAIAARLYHAAGYFAPCDSVVYFDPKILRLLPGLSATDNTGTTRAFDQVALDALLANATHRGELVRMGASRWLPGIPIGPATYEGTRHDDPNDVVPHEDRRELRGARLLAAWLNHFDSREQNSMDVFIPLSADPTGRLGHVRHYILDLGDCFGSVWSSDEISKRLGHAYYLDFPYLAEDFLTFGTIERPWDRAQRDAGIFNYFSARDFDAERWRGGYPNPAFTRMTEADGAWMARIISRFDDPLLEAAVAVGQYETHDARYLVETLRSRRDRLLRRYLRKLSPIADLQVRGRKLCGVDLARKAGVAERDARGVSARLEHDGSASELPSSRIEVGQGGALCIELPPAASSPDAASNAATPEAPRYLVVEIDNGDSETPLRAHLYDLGRAQGLRLVGIERD